MVPVYGMKSKVPIYSTKTYGARLRYETHSTDFRYVLSASKVPIYGKCHALL